jgi:hypothetical protein
MRLVKKPLPPFAALKSSQQTRKLKIGNSVLGPRDIEALYSKKQQKTGFGRTYFYDQCLGLVNLFVNKVTLEKDASLIPWGKEPVIFVANHQVLIESAVCIPILIILANSEITMDIISRKELEETWIKPFSALLNDSYDDKGLFGPLQKIHFLDRSKPKDFFQVLQEYTLRSAKSKRPISLYVHIEGHREIKAAQKVAKMSTVFIDIALKNRFPIIPIRFSGALPADTETSPLAYPLNYCKQDYKIGQPILPEEIEQLSYPDRAKYVLEAINALCDPNEQPLPGNDALGQHIDETMKKTGLSRNAVILLCALQTVENRSPVSDELLEFFMEGNWQTKPRPLNPLVNYLINMFKL